MFDRDIDNFRKINVSESDQDFGFPICKGVDTTPNILNVIGFNEVLSYKGNKKDTGVHFYIHDYQFSRIWKSPDKYIDILKEFAWVMQPDFSMFVDMPLVMQMWKHYQKMWFSYYMQKCGLVVIPTIGWSDSKSFDFCFKGQPTHSVVSVSSVGCMSDKDAMTNFENGYNAMASQLSPSQVLFFGKIPKTISQTNIIQIEHIFDTKFKKLKQNGR